MGEYIRYRNEELKIGTCENLYYISYQKYIKALEAKQLSGLSGNGYPSEYARPDSGFRFRFPFPDEDRLPFASIIEPFNRSVAIEVNAQYHDEIGNGAKGNGKHFHVELAQQKLVHRESDGKLVLAVVLRNPESGDAYRVEDKSVIDKLAREIVRNHILNESNQEKRNFYRILASRMLKGYQLDLPVKINQKEQNKKNITKTRRGTKLR